jgi:hypothetical protein
MRHSIAEGEKESYSLLNVRETEESDPILKREDEPAPPSNAAYVSWAYCVIMAINGGACGAFGPALEMLERMTGLNQATLGGAVLANRVAKLIGTVVWGVYASYVQRQMETGGGILVQPHILMSFSLLCTAISCAVIGVTRSGIALQVIFFSHSPCSSRSLHMIACASTHLPPATEPNATGRG